MVCWTVHLHGGQQQPYGYPAAVAVQNNVYTFGGPYNANTAQMEMEVHVFNTVSLRWRKLTPVTKGGERHPEVPSSHQLSHTAVLMENIVYIWGGYNLLDDRDDNALYTFDVDSHRWFKPRVSGTVPERRQGHSACVLGKVMYVYGMPKLTGWPNAMYMLDTTTMVWCLINRDVQALVCHTATIIGTKMFVFGGYWCGMYGAGTYGDDVFPCYNNSIRVFDTETNRWLNTPSARLRPEIRAGHSAFDYNGQLYIFGGCNLTHTFNDLWVFKPETLSWKRVEPKGIKGPSPTYTMCCCRAGDRIILFGGRNTPDELFILDLSPSPSLKMLCKLAVIQYGLDQSDLLHNIRWELAAMK